MDLEDRERAIRLLEATHTFPCPYLIKVIGRSDDTFVQRVMEALHSVQQSDCTPPCRTRQTPNGRHIAVTLEPTVASAEEVLEIYRCVRQVDGVVMMM